MTALRERTAAEWNGVRHVAQRGRGHVESYFLKLGSADGRRALWIKTTILESRGGRAVAEAWAVAFDREGAHVAAKETVALDAARFARDRLAVRVADVVVEEGRVRGSVTGSASTGARTHIAFDLAFTDGAPPLVPFPHAVMYDGPLPSSKIVSPHPDSLFDGHYEVDGARVDVDRWRGMEGHNWGAKHAELYAWGHCNQWDDADDLVLEGVTARVKVGPLLTPPLTVVCVRAGGVRYDFHGLRTIATTRAVIGARRWTFTAHNALARVTGELWAETRDFVGLAYENPDGAITYCLNSKLARARLRLEPRGRAPIEAVTRCAALELGTRDPSHGVTMMA